ncbi:MAG: transporter substrate-binding domain-containing protein [Phycisphaerales bacterium]|nr:transporter substrate-binding domain-containing protein [Phycisphaerales bacterium]
MRCAADRIFGGMTAVPVLLVLFLVFATGAQSPQAPPKPAPLRVGTTTKLPYSWKDVDGRWVGPAIMLWERIAQIRGVSYELMEKSDEGLAAGLHDGTLDVAATGVQISASAGRSIKFSLPFDAGGVLGRRAPDGSPKG